MATFRPAQYAIVVHIRTGSCLVRSSQNVYFEIVTKQNTVKQGITRHTYIHHRLFNRSIKCSYPATKYSPSAKRVTKGEGREISEHTITCAGSSSSINLQISSALRSSSSVNSRPCLRKMVIQPLYWNRQMSP